MARARTPGWWLLPVVIGLGIGLWQTAGVWGPGPVRGDDTMAQLVRNGYGLDLFADGRADGWFPRFMLGHQLFLFFGPGFTVVLGALRLATFGLMSTAGAYKAASVLGIAGLAPAALFLARSLGLRRADAAAGSLLVLAVNNPFGLGLHGTYVIGLVPHQVAACFFCVALGSLARTFHDPRRRWVTLGAGALAAVALIHPITALVLAVFLALAVLAALAHGRVWWAGLRRVVLIGGAAIGITGFWSVPFLAHRDLQGPVTAWATPPLTVRIAELAGGDILWPAPLFVLAVLGAMVCGALAVRTRQRWHAFVAVAPAAYLGLAHLVAARVDGAVSLQLANRGLGYAGLIAMLGAGVAVGAGVRVLASADRRPPPAHALRPARGEGLGTIALATLAAATVVVLATADARQPAGTEDPPGSELREVAAVLAEVVPASGRFATERDFPAEIARTGTVHPDLWLVAASGRNTLNLFNPESSPTDAGFAAERIGRESPQVTAQVLSRYAVTHVVTVRPDTTVRFADSVAFVEVSRHGDLGVFALRAAPSRPSPAAMVAPIDPLVPLDATMVRWSPDEVTIDVDARRDTTATVALSWSPKWTATLDSKPAVTAPDRHGVLTVQIPEGRHRLTLQFGPDVWDRVGWGVTGATGTVAAVALLWDQARRRRRT